MSTASLPIVTLAGIQLGTLFSGAVIVETIFAWPGVGQMAIQALNQRDYNVVQGVVLVLGIVVVLVNALINSVRMVDHIFVMTRGGPDNASTLLLYYIYQVGFSFWDSG